MKVLGSPPPTPEQLCIIGNTRIGTEIIRGAAGSGKTTTALLRLRTLADMFRARHTRLEIETPVRALVLTFNRTLCGYIEALAQEQRSRAGNVEIYVSTFAQWAYRISEQPSIHADRAATVLAISTRYGISLSPEYLCSEVEYVLGRFDPESRSDYLTAERSGRGTLPRVDVPIRRVILEIIDGYERRIAADDKIDWEGLSTGLQAAASEQFEIIIVDEAQDFSANQLRAIRHHLSEVHALTLVIDTAQRLYPRGYTWAEVGIDQARYSRLNENFRNTKQIALFARGIVEGLSIDDDGTLPDLNQAKREGDIPLVIVGSFSQQMDRCLSIIEEDVDLETESVAFLHPQGGGYFWYAKKQLVRHQLQFEEITRQRDWPNGPSNIILSTMHSAKGLEFDHVFIIGLNDQVTPHGAEAIDDRITLLRRLLAMAAARARKTLVVGYKDDDASALVNYFEEGTFDECQL